MAGYPGGSESFVDYLFVDVLGSAGFSVGGDDAAWNFIEVAVLQLFLGVLDEEVVEVLLPLILFLPLRMVVDFKPVQLLELLLGLFVKLLLYLQLRGLFGGAGGRVALLFSYSLALAPVCARPIEFLEQGAEVFNAGEFVEAKELFLFDLFVAEGVLADGSFEEVEGVEKVDLRGLVVDAELVVVL